MEYKRGDSVTADDTTRTSVPNMSKNIHKHVFKLLQSSSTHNFILYLEQITCPHVITSAIMASLPIPRFATHSWANIPLFCNPTHSYRFLNYCLSLSTLQWVKKDAVPLLRSYSIAHGATTANVTSMTWRFSSLIRKLSISSVTTAIADWILREVSCISPR